MYKIRLFKPSLIIITNTLEGETIEMKVARLEENKEPIDDGAPLIYTARKDGVDPAYNIRTDRFEIATDIMDKLNRDKTAKSEGTFEIQSEGDAEGKEINIEFGKPEPTADTATK